jgi:PKD repeat protein
VSFTDLSTGGPTGWSWSFGDGSTSIVQNPTHAYTVAGLYTVTLVASNPGGSDSITKTDLVDVGPSSPIQTYLATADARVNEGSPNSNAGTATELRVRSEVGGSYHSYLRFDLTGLSGTVTSAKLRLFCTDGSPVGGVFFPTSNVWTETGINWTNKPAATGSQVASVGTVATGAWVEVDVTTAIGAPGVVNFLMTSTSTNSALYSSREGTNRPELVVTTGSP